MGGLEQSSMLSPSWSEGGRSAGGDESKNKNAVTRSHARPSVTSTRRRVAGLFPSRRAPLHGIAARVASHACATRRGMRGGGSSNGLAGPQQRGSSQARLVSEACQRMGAWQPPVMLGASLLLQVGECSWPGRGHREQQPCRSESVAAQPVRAGAGPVPSSAQKRACFRV